MPYFRIDEPAAEPAREAQPLPDVQIQMVHEEWLIVAIVDADGKYQDVKRADNPRQAIELAQNLALLGIAAFDGKIHQVRALVA